jgi:hypothetical protein
MRGMMASARAWDEAAREHYRPMSAAAGPDLPVESLQDPVLGRILRVVLAAILAGSAILLAG